MRNSSTPSSVLLRAGLVGAALLGASQPALAGGVGFIGTAGVHTARAYYYNDEGQQGIDLQARPNMGAGLEVVLGDRDDRIQGVVRLYSLTDWPLNDPDLSKEDPSYDYTFPPESSQPKKTTGALTAGVQWGLWGDPEGLEIVAHTLVGSGFLSKDNLEFLILEPGAGATWRMNDRVQLVGTAAWTVRYRKYYSNGANVYAGVRYLFD